MKYFNVAGACAAVLLAACSSQSGTQATSEEMQEQGVVQAQAQDSRSENPNPQMDPMMVQNTMVLNQLHHINQKEIAMAELAKSKTTGMQAKNMADRLIADHEKMDERLKIVAERAGVELASFQPATHEMAMMDTMKELEGKQFDQAFMQSMKASHEMALENLRAAKRLVKDPQIIQAINEAMPQIQKHHRSSRAAAQNVSANM